MKAGNVVRNGMIVLTVIASSLLGGAGVGSAEEENAWVVYEMTNASVEAALEDSNYAFDYFEALWGRHAGALVELGEAFAAARELETLAGILDITEGRAIGVYDARGLWDPMGTGEADSGSGIDENGSDFASIFALGKTAPDPMDVGLPGSNSESSPFAPDIGGAIGGIAGKGTSYSRVARTSSGWSHYSSHTSHGTTIWIDTVYRDDGTIHQATGVMDDAGDVTWSSVDINEDGRIDQTSSYTRGVGRSETTIEEDGSSHTDTTPETTELTNPEYAPDMGCVLPWLCDAETPEEMMERWTTGANEGLTMDEAADIPVNQVPAFLTLFDLLSNPGYIDGLYINDEGGVGGSTLTPENPVTQY